MRRLWVLAVMACVACGGANEAGSKAKTGGGGDSDKGFADYAASHGIQTLEGGGQAPEVTADGLRLEKLDASKPVKLDGVLLEWPAPAKATTVTKGSTQSGLKIGLQYDDAKLYVGADVSDASFEAGRDHVSLVLAVPTPGGSYAVYDLALYAGKPGDSEGSVRWERRGGRVPGAKIVEAPESGGYSFEAVVPWSALPEARTTKVGVHGVAAYVDGDGVVATGPGDAQHPRDMPWVPSEPELSMIEQLLEPKGLTKRAPDVEAVADLTGDGQRERVAVWENVLTVCGTSYLGGTGFFYRDLGGELVKLDLRDVTGRGKADIVVRRRQSVGDATREYLEVMSVLRSEAPPAITFAHEIAVRQSDKHIDDSVHMARGSIEVSVEPPTGWDVASYREPIASNAEPILFPWGGVRTAIYRFDGTRFVRTREIRQKEQIRSGGPVAAGGGAALEPSEPPTPKVTRGGGDLSGQVLEQYRRDRSAGDDAPKVDLRVQVAGDARPERVVLLGRDLVVFGPGFKGGTGYTYLTLQQFASPADIEDVSARDLTGDGAADLVVRGVRRVSSDRGQVTEDVMFVYQVKEDAITRVFGIETAREQKRKRVQGLVQFIPSAGGKTFDILSAPGRAIGWTEKTYPWAQDTPGNGNLEPLLLPWGGIASVRYAWDGSSFAKQ